MNRKYYRRSSNINAAVWLIGLGILWLTNLWWPGILILVGVSMLVQAIVHNGIEREPEIITTSSVEADTDTTDKKSSGIDETPETKKDDTWDDEDAETPAFMQTESHALDKLQLPEKCPACGGPVAENAHKVEWVDEHKARCPFCDTIINV